MKSIGLLALFFSMVTAQTASAQDIKVKVQISHIFVDYTNRDEPKIGFDKVCEVEATMKYQDVRAEGGQNANPEEIPNSCKFEYLGNEITPSIWAGAAAFLQRDENGLSDTYGALGTIKVGDEISRSWILSKKSSVEDVQLIVQTPDRVHPTIPKRTDSLQVTYQFSK